MGYTTEFKGRFTLSKLPKAETIAALLSLAGENNTGYKGAPDSYYQWKLHKSCRHIEWDGGEKFYLYVEWLQFILNAFLNPEGIALDGEVEFEGEDSEDMGVLKVVKGKVVTAKVQPVSDDLDELITFRDFILKSDYADDILAQWKRSRK